MLYHATPIDNTEAIESEGLQANPLNQPIYAGMYGATETVSDGVYVTKSLDNAETYADWLKTEKELGDDADMAIYEIDISIKAGDIYTDPEGDMFGDAISASGKIYADDIPAAQIERVQ